MGFRLTYLYLTLIHSKSQCQCHEHFDREDIENGDRLEKHYYYHQIGS